MDATEKETEIARRYLTGEYTEVQMNYLAHECGSTRERMDRIVEHMAITTPLIRASKVVLMCIVVHFIACTAYSIASLFRG